MEIVRQLWCVVKTEFTVCSNEQDQETGREFPEPTLSTVPEEVQVGLTVKGGEQAVANNGSTTLISVR